MSIKELDRIDAIGVDINTEDLIVSIIDDLDWENENLHIFYLGEKIAAYLNFLDSEALYKVYPDAEGRRISIKIYARHPLPPKGKTVMESLAAQVYENGFKLLHGIYPDLTPGPTSAPPSS